MSCSRLCGDDLGLRPRRWDRLAEVVKCLHVAVDRFADGFDCVLACGSGGDAAGQVGHLNAERAVIGGLIFRVKGSNKSPLLPGP